MLMKRKVVITKSLPKTSDCLKQYPSNLVKLIFSFVAVLISVLVKSNYFYDIHDLYVFIVNVK